MLIILMIVVGVDIFLFPEIPSFHNTMFNPYLIICLLAAAYFGLRETLAVSILYVATYLAILYFTTDFEKVETIFAGEYLAIPALILFLCPVISEFIQKKRERVIIAEGQAKEANLILEQKEEIYQRTQQEITQIRKRLITKTDTLASLSDYIQGFINLDDSNELLASFSNIVTDTLNVSKGGIYLKTEESRLTLLHPMGKHFPRVAIDICSPDMAMARRAVEKVELVKLDYIPEDESQRAGNCILAAPFTNAEGVALGVVLIEDMEFLSYVPSNFTALSIYLSWFSKSWQLCKEMEKYKTSVACDPLSQLYFDDFYFPLVTKLACFNRNLSTIIEVNFDEAGTPERQKRKKVFRLLALVLHKKISTPILAGVSSAWETIRIFPMVADGEESNQIATMILREIDLLGLKDSDKKLQMKVLTRKITDYGKIELVA